MQTVRRIVRKISVLGFLALAVPIAALWEYMVVPLVIVGWLLYRVVTRAADRPCKECGTVHESCPCCGWICSNSDERPIG